MTEPKPCPFCGETMTMKQSIGCNGGFTRWLNCENCFAHGPMCPLDFDDDPVDAWNKRPIEDELVDALKRVRKLLQEGKFYEAWHEINKVLGIV